MNSSKNNRYSFLKLNDRKTLEQCLTFVKRRDGKQAAEDGYHDDFVMAKAISLKARSQQTYLITKEDIFKEKSTNYLVVFKFRK